jgi:L-ascorbate metabolism protein UlaG (beta-lactamase superfamily)
MKAIFFLLISTTVAMAQRPSADVYETSKGNLTVQPILHGTVVFTWAQKVIYVDPYGGAKAFQGIASPDLVLITDIHGDHLNTETLKALDLSHAVIVAPKAVVDQLPDDLKAKAVVLNNGATTTQHDIPMAAIPMYNLPESPDARHTKGRGNGYILTFGNRKVYLSGDTAGIPEMRSLKDIYIAFVCMNLPYTMDINEAASAVLDFKPQYAYPYHYRGQNGLSDTDAFAKLVNASNKDIQVRLRNWYPEY